MSDFEWNVGPATTAAEILEDTAEVLSQAVPDVNAGAFWHSRNTFTEARDRMEQLRGLLAESSTDCAQKIRLSSEAFIQCDMTVADRAELVRQQIRDAPPKAWGF